MLNPPGIVPFPEMKSGPASGQVSRSLPDRADALIPTGRNLLQGNTMLVRVHHEGRALVSRPRTGQGSSGRVRTTASSTATGAARSSC
jgi:hypothetical protein